MRVFAALSILLAGCSAHAGKQKVFSIEDIDEKSLAAATRGINSAKNEPVELDFNSRGGFVEDGLDFIRAMERAQGRGVVFICTADEAASMGAVIYSACDVRLAKPRALFLIHHVTGASSQHLEEKITEALFHQICRVTKISFEELEIRAKTDDYWFTAFDARDIGLVEIILP